MEDCLIVLTKYFLKVSAFKFEIYKISFKILGLAFMKIQIFSSDPSPV